MSTCRQRICQECHFPPAHARAHAHAEDESAHHFDAAFDLRPVGRVGRQLNEHHEVGRVAGCRERSGSREHLRGRPLRLEAACGDWLCRWADLVQRALVDALLRLHSILLGQKEEWRHLRIQSLLAAPRVRQQAARQRKDQVRTFGSASASR